MIQYPTVEQVIRANATYGGVGAGLLDRNGVEAAVARPQATFDGVDLYPSIWQKAAVLLHGLCSTQYFADGNKRTAWIVAETFLGVNTHELAEDLDVDDAEAFTLGVATSSVSIEEAANWYYNHVPPLVAELDEDGLCLLCGNDGRLVGVEFYPREALMQVGWPVDGAVMASYAQEPDRDSDMDYSVVPFRPDRDLVGQVCRNCRDGWISVLDRMAYPIILPMLEAVEKVVLGPNERRILAAWAVKQTALRAIIGQHPTTGSLHSLLGLLRQRRLVSTDWQVLVAASVGNGQSLGRFVWGQISAEDDAPTGQIGAMQHTFQFGHIVFVNIYHVRSADFFYGDEPAETFYNKEDEVVRPIVPTSGYVVWPPPRKSTHEEIQAAERILLDLLTGADGTDGTD